MSANRVCELRIVGGKGLKDVGSFGKMSPYCVVSIDNHEKQKSPTATHEGSNPTWNATFKFHPLEDMLRDSRKFVLIQLIHAGKMGEVPAGSVHIPLPDFLLAEGSEVPKAYPAVDASGRPHGSVDVVLHLLPSPLGVGKAGASAPPAPVPVEKASAPAGAADYAVPAAAAASVAYAAPAYAAPAPSGYPPAAYGAPPPYGGGYGAPPPYGAAPGGYPPAYYPQAPQPYYQPQQQQAGGRFGGGGGGLGAGGGMLAGAAGGLLVGGLLGNALSGPDTVIYDNDTYVDNSGGGDFDGGGGDFGGDF